MSLGRRWWNILPFNLKSEGQGQLWRCFLCNAVLLTFFVVDGSLPRCTELEREANMAAKAGDNPDSLMSVATVFCLRNLRKTMCYQGFRSKLSLRSDIFLPSEICDKLVNTYVPSSVRGPQFRNILPSKFPMFVHPTDSMLFLFKQIYGVGPHRQ